jgi:hypothetical protein
MGKIMNPVNFPEANGTHTAPSGMTEEQCGPAPSWTGEDKDGTPIVICCWQPTDNELTEIIAEGLIYVGFVGGGVLPHIVYPGNPFGRKFEKGSLALKILEEQKHKQALQECWQLIYTYYNTQLSAYPSDSRILVSNIKTLIGQTLGESQ